MRRFQNHAAIAENFDLKVLKPDMFSLSRAASFLAAIFRDTAEFASEHPPSPFLTCGLDHNLQWLDDFPEMTRYSLDNTVAGNFNFSRGSTQYRLDYFTDRSAMLSFTEEGGTTRKYAPWAIQFEHFFQAMFAKFDIAIHPIGPARSRFKLIPQAHQMVDTRDHQDANTAFSRAMFEDVVAIIDAFQGATPLLRNFTDPGWLQQQHLALPPFATFSNPTQDHREEIRQLLVKLTRYISAANPGLTLIAATCFAAYLDEENRLQPCYIELSCGGKRIEGNPAEFSRWFKQYMNHRKCVVPRHIQFIQDLGGPAEIAKVTLSDKMVTSAHERLTAYADMKPFFDVLPAPEGQEGLLS